MTNTVLEFAKITLAPTASEADLLAASATFEAEFLTKQDGFIRRDLVRTGDGTYADVILWESREKADAVFAAAQTSPAADGYFEMMHMDPDADPGDIVAHYAVLRSVAA